MNIGGFNRPNYDACAFQKRIRESTSPLAYRLYQGKYEHSGKCVHDKFWTPMQLVDVESELRNQTRPLSKCDKYKYNKGCERSAMCWNTFDASVPIVYAPEVCSPIKNNIPRTTDNGLPPMPKGPIDGTPVCTRK